MSQTKRVPVDILVPADVLKCINSWAMMFMMSRDDVINMILKDSLKKRKEC